MYSANVFHMQAANSEDHFMGFRVQVDGAFSNQQSNVCVNNDFYHYLYRLYYLWNLLHYIIFIAYMYIGFH